MSLQLTDTPLDDLLSREWLTTLLREHLNAKIIRPRLQQKPLPAMAKMIL